MSNQQNRTPYPKPVDLINAELRLNPELRRCYHHHTRLKKLPPVMAGMALLCTEPNEVASTLHYALQPQTRQQCQEKVRQLALPQQAARKIIETLMTDYRS